jgi:hypothetical protein
LQYRIKGLWSLKKISLNHNKLSALQPKTFSDLSNLEELWLADNVCVNKDFYYISSKLVIEKELVACTVGHIVQEQLKSRDDALSSSIDQKFESRFEELERKFDQRNEENVKEIREIRGLLEKIVAMTTKQ